MGRLVVFSVSSFLLAFVAVTGLAAYTAARPLDAGLSVRDSLRSRTSASTSPLLPNPGSSSRTFPTRCSTVLFGKKL